MSFEFLKQGKENSEHFFEHNEGLRKARELFEKKTPVTMKLADGTIEHGWRITQVVAEDAEDQGRPKIVAINKTGTLRRVVGLDEFLGWQEE